MNGMRRMWVAIGAAFLCTGMLSLPGAQLPAMAQSGQLFDAASIPMAVTVLEGPGAPLDIVVGQAGTNPADVGEVLARGVPLIVRAGGPQVTFAAIDFGYVYGQQAIFLITGSDRPWRIMVTGTAMAREAGSPDQFIPPSRIEIRDAKKPTDWVAIAGGPELQNPAGEEDQWMQIEFRIMVEEGDAAGHYAGDVVLEWMLAPDPGEPPPTGSISLELHLDIPEIVGMAAEPELTFTEGTEATFGGTTGWCESDESLLAITSNTDFSLALSVCPDLTGPEDHEIETALRLRQPVSSGALWETWGNLGGDRQGTCPDGWPSYEDSGAPWPGNVEEPAVIQTQGINEIGLTVATYRAGATEPAGTYNTVITITVSVP